MNLLTKIDITKTRIIQALTCAAGFHEPWERDVNYTLGRSAPVRFSLQSNGHGNVFCAVCRHCRAVYVRRKDE